MFISEGQITGTGKVCFYWEMQQKAAQIPGVQASSDAQWYWLGEHASSRTDSSFADWCTRGPLSCKVSLSSPSFLQFLGSLVFYFGDAIDHHTGFSSSCLLTFSVKSAYHVDVAWLFFVQTENDGGAWVEDPEDLKLWEHFSLADW